MADEISSMVQVMDMSVKGMSFGVKACKEGIELAKKIACLLSNLLKHIFHLNNDYGRTTVKNLKNHLTGNDEIVPIKIESEEMRKLFMKRATKAGMLFSKGPDYKDGSYSVFVKASDVNLAKHILSELGKEKMKDVAKQDRDKVEKDFLQNNSVIDLSEYANSSGLVDCPLEKFDQINREYFGEEYESIEDLKKNAELSEEVRNTLGKAVHESDLRENCMSTDYVVLGFDKSMITNVNEENKTVQVAIPDADIKVDLPADRILVDDKKEHYLFSQSKDKPLQVTEYYQGIQMDREVEGKDFKSFMDEKKENISKNKEVLTNENKMCITINMEKLFKSETDKDITTRIPGTYGDNEMRVTFDKADTKKLHDDKDLMVILDKNKSYKVEDRNGNVQRMSGEDLMSRYNDQSKYKNRSATTPKKPDGPDFKNPSGRKPVRA